MDFHQGAAGFFSVSSASRAQNRRFGLVEGTESLTVPAGSIIVKRNPGSRIGPKPAAHPASVSPEYWRVQSLSGRGDTAGASSLVGLLLGRGVPPGAVVVD